MSKIVFKGKTADNIPYTIRYPKRTDLNELWRYINDLSKEKTFISFQGEEISLKDERSFLNAMLKKIKEKKSIFLIAESNDKIVAVSNIDMLNRVKKHIGYFGISVTKEYRGLGIGKKIMESAIKEAQENLPGLKIIYLDVFGNNPIAKDLYKSFGFKEYGVLPGGLLYHDQPADEILMYREI